MRAAPATARLCAAAAAAWLVRYTAPCSPCRVPARNCRSLLPQHLHQSAAAACSPCPPAPLAPLCPPLAHPPQLTLLCHNHAGHCGLRQVRPAPPTPTPPTPHPTHACWRALSCLVAGCAYGHTLELTCAVPPSLFSCAGDLHAYSPVEAGLVVVIVFFNFFYVACGCSSAPVSPCAEFPVCHHTALHSS